MSCIVSVKDFKSLLTKYARKKYGYQWIKPLANDIGLTECKFKQQFYSKHPYLIAEKMNATIGWVYLDLKRDSPLIHSSMLTEYCQNIICEEYQGIVHFCHVHRIKGAIQFKDFPCDRNRLALQILGIMPYKIKVELHKSSPLMKLIKPIEVEKRTMYFDGDKEVIPENAEIDF
jgi:hypothetical protein